jgi:lactate permease
MDFSNNGFRGRFAVYKQVLDPVSNSLGLTSIFALLPLVVLFVLLGGLRMKAQWASLIALAVAIIVALAVYSSGWQ